MDLDARTGGPSPFEPRLPARGGEDGGGRILPFVVGVLADLSGSTDDSRPPLSERKFISVDRDNFDAYLGSLAPGLKLAVENTLQGDGSLLEVQLRFRSMEDFEPARVIAQVRPLRELLESRRRIEARPKGGTPRPAGMATPLLDSILDESPSPPGAPSAGEGSPTSTVHHVLSRQLAAILRTREFQDLEAAWRGLHRLVLAAETGPRLRIKVMDVSKKDLGKDFQGADGFDQSGIFEKVFEDVYGVADAEPFGVLLGSYRFSNHPEDLDLLAGLARVAAASFCPFIADADPAFFGLEDFVGLPGSDNLVRILDGPPYARWRSFRDSEESRFVALVLPRILARLPYGKRTRPAEGLEFEEVVPGRETWKDLHPQLLWMNSAWALAARMAASAALTGWSSKIGGAEGGLVEGLPIITFRDDSGAKEALTTETPIPVRKAEELAQVGCIPLVHRKGTDTALFSGLTMIHRAKRSADAEATATEALWSRLPCVLAFSRIVQHLLVLSLDSPEGFRDPAGWREGLERWMAEQVAPIDGPPGERDRYPLREGQVEVKEAPGLPGLYRVTVSVKPAPSLAGGELSRPLKITLTLPFSP